MENATGTHAVTTTPLTPERPRPLRAIFWGGLGCGVLDLAFAVVFFTQWRGAKPLAVLQSIAAGVLGAETYRGGAATAALGVALHFGISFGAAATFYLVSRQLRFLTRHALLHGLWFGLAVYLFMQAVVLPLSAAPNAKFPPQITARAIPVILAHVFLVGPPIALAARRFGGR